MSDSRALDLQLAARAAIEAYRKYQRASSARTKARDESRFQQAMAHLTDVVGIPSTPRVNRRLQEARIHRDGRRVEERGS